MMSLISLPSCMKGFVVVTPKGNHYPTGKSLSYREMTQGFWWPNMQRDAAEYVKKCD